MFYKIEINDSPTTRGIFAYVVMTNDNQSRYGWRLISLARTVQQAQSIIDDLKKNRIGEVQ